MAEPVIYKPSKFNEVFNRANRFLEPAGKIPRNPFLGPESSPDQKSDTGATEAKQS